jgi:hypothetical protein
MPEGAAQLVVGEHLLEVGQLAGLALDLQRAAVQDADPALS